MPVLLDCLRLARAPFVRFGADGRLLECSPEARILMDGQADTAVPQLGLAADRLLHNTRQGLAEPHEFDLCLSGRALHVGAVRVSEAGLSIEVVMVLSIPAEHVEAPLHRFFDARQLTAREREVATYVATGLPSPDIARRLGISVHTVRRHTERIFSKTGARSRSQLTRVVTELRDAGFLPDPSFHLTVSA
jgi:DNA-binding CsgD family transcriptional regulator